MCIFCKDWTDPSNCGHVLLNGTLLPFGYATPIWTMAIEISTRAMKTAELENSRQGFDHIIRQTQYAGHAWTSLTYT